MRSFDFSPLYRSTVGFDRLFDLLDNVSKVEASSGYPPYNIERRSDDAYRISVAVAGFGEADLGVEVRENVLVLSGSRNDEDAERESEFLHRGIAGRTFERRFQLADHVEVVLRGANFHGAEVAGVEFSHADLRGTHGLPFEDDGPLVAGAG
ncbi:MAG: Hsp20 family protein [Pseudomonadota bacterium]